MMPPASRAETRSERDEAMGPAAALAAAGLGLLMLRVRLLGVPSAPALFAAMYVLVGAASVAAPIGLRDERRLRPEVALALGVGAIVAATLLTGRLIPNRIGPTALALNALAAVSEEAFFRRFLYGRLLRFGAAPAVAATALLFALVHLPAYGLAAFWVDLGAGLLLSWQRWASGTWAVPAATHVAANMMVVLP